MNIRKKSVLRCHARVPVVTIALFLSCVALYCHAASEELPARSENGLSPRSENALPARSENGSIAPADTAPAVIVGPQEEAKPQTKRDRMLTEDEAYDLVWNLPEVKKEIEKILDQGGIPLATVAMRPNQSGKPEEKNSLYAIRFQGVLAKNIAVELLFYVDANDGQVLVYESSTGKLIPVDEWRRRK